MRAFVTGGAGFVGSNLTDRLVKDGHNVVVYDNFSTGSEQFLEDALASGRVTVVRGDLLDRAAMRVAMKGCDLVAHIAADADVRFGTLHPERDLFHFVKSLRADPSHLRVLGNGKQRKSYLYVGDCIDAMLLAPETAPGPVNIFNVGADEYCEVVDSVRSITECLRLTAGGARVRAHDPVVKALPDASLATLCNTAAEALRDADVLVVATEWPEYRDAAPAGLDVVDENRLIGPRNGVRYHSAGAPA